MRSEDRQIALLCAAFLAVGCLAWMFHLRAPLEADASTLGRVPLSIGDWSGRDLPLDDAIVRMLDADYNVQRTYVHATGAVAWLYVGYYGTRRGGRPEHTPWQCYPSNGWKIVEHRVVEVPLPRAHRANELVVEARGTRRLVHFWYQSHRRSGLLGGFDQALDRLLGRLIDGRADGALVRLSTGIESGEDEGLARSRLISLATEILPLLEAHWPHEHGGEAEAPRDSAPAQNRV